MRNGVDKAFPSRFGDSKMYLLIIFINRYIYCIIEMIWLNVIMTFHIF